MRKPLAVSVVLVVAMFAPVSQAGAAPPPGGPLVLMGIDGEDGGVGGHGPLSAYTGVVADILANVVNGGSGILVIGGGKSPGDNVTTWWSALAASVGQSVTFSNGSAVGTVPFTGYAMIGIASSEWQTSSGGLTQAENNAFAPREADLATFVNAGGGLFGLSQDGLSPAYPYLNALGAFTIQTGRGDGDVTPTAEGVALGLDATSLDVCCWHDGYLAYPDFLLPLVDYADGVDGAIGGKRIVIPRACTDAEMPTIGVARPAAGRVYLDDVDTGAAPTSEAIVKGFGTTIAGAAGPTVHKIDIRLDNTLLGSPTSAPFSVTVPTPSLGQHTVKITAWNNDLLCFKTITQTFTVACVGVGVAVTRPAAGRAYLDDLDIGPSGSSDPFLLGGPLRAEATATDPAHTLDVSFRYDADPTFGTDTAGNPFDATTSVDGLAPGTHLLTATLREHTAGCTTAAVLLVRRQDPRVKAVAEGLSVTTNIPAEPQVRAGGAQISSQGGSSSIRVLDRSAPPVDSVHAITDSASGSVAPFTSRSSSLVSDLSINGGLITAETLHARARADFDIATLSGAAVDDGSRIANLQINGTPVPLTAPNTQIALPGGLGRVVVHETIADTNGFTREITVNMLHVWLTTPTFKGEIIVGSAHAGVSLPGGPFVGPAADLIHLPDDAGSGRDAGDTLAGAIALADGTYGGGMLSSADTLDVYTVQAGQGDRITVEMLPSARERVTFGATPMPSVTGPIQPNFDLILRDPSGAIRDRSEGLIGGSEPERLELNADTPYVPAGARGTWSFEVRQRSAVLGFYTLNVHIVPVMLRAQNDGDLPGDASASCASPRALPSNGTENDVNAYTGVIRDDDQGDTYSVEAEIGQTLAVTMKPDELADGADFDLFLYAPSAPGGNANCSSPYSASQLGKEPLPKALPDLVGAIPVRLTGTYVIEVRRINAVANYTLQVSLVNDQPTLPDNDAGTGADAADACADATPIGSGLYQGRLGDVPDDDREDWYAVTLTAGQDLIAVMKAADPNDLTLRLYRPDCTPAPLNTTTVTGMPLSAPEAAHQRDATAGTWRLAVTRYGGSADGGNYALGVTVTP